MQWTGTIPWTARMLEGNPNIFGICSSRFNEREAMNATMAGHDIFVLMPTGGGQSLYCQFVAAHLTSRGDAVLSMGVGACQVTSKTSSVATTGDRARISAMSALGAFGTIPRKRTPLISANAAVASCAASKVSPCFGSRAARLVVLFVPLRRQHVDLAQVRAPAPCKSVILYHFSE